MNHRPIGVPPLMSTLLDTTSLICMIVLLCAPRAATAAQPAAGRTLQLVTDNACQTQISALLDQWEADRREEGWKVLKRILCPADAEALKAKLLAIRPDHTFLVGDSVPFLKVMANPDGHAAREIIADYKFVQDSNATPFGAIGRIWFKSQKADVDSMGLYRRYFAKRHTWQEDRVRYGPMVAFNDHLSYLADGKVWANSVMKQVPPNRLEHLELGAVESDGEITRRAKSPRLIEIVFSGGQPFTNPGGLYYFGGAAAWRNADPSNPGIGPRIGMLGAYGSSICHIELENSFLIAVLTTKHTLASFYDMRGTFAFGPMFTGSTIGDCGRASAEACFYISNVFGDPTLTIAVAR